MIKSILILGVFVLLGMNANTAFAGAKCQAAIKVTEDKIDTASVPQGKKNAAFSLLLKAKKLESSGKEAGCVKVAKKLQR